MVRKLLTGLAFLVAATTANAKDMYNLAISKADNKINAYIGATQLVGPVKLDEGFEVNSGLLNVGIGLERNIGENTSLYFQWTGRGTFPYIFGKGDSLDWGPSVGATTKLSDKVDVYVNFSNPEEKIVRAGVRIQR